MKLEGRRCRRCAPVDRFPDPAVAASEHPAHATRISTPTLVRFAPVCDDHLVPSALDQHPTRPTTADRYRALSRRRTTAPFLIGSVGIAVLSLIALLVHRSSSGVVFEIADLMNWAFDVGQEANLATWYASGMWLAFGVLAALAAVSRPAHRLSWILLAVVAIGASFDEFIAAHERLHHHAERIGAMVGIEVGFSWVLLGAPVALLVGLLLLRFVLSLPRRARTGILIGGVVFVAGALGVETVNGQMLEAAGWVETTPYLFTTMLEELLEMSGLALALGAVLSLLQHDPGTGSVRWDPALRGPASAPESDGTAPGHSAAPSS